MKEQLDILIEFIDGTSIENEFEYIIQKAVQLELKNSVLLELVDIFLKEFRLEDPDYLHNFDKKNLSATPFQDYFKSKSH